MLIFTVLYLIFFVYGITQLKNIYNKFSYGITVLIMIALFIAIFIYYLYFTYLIFKKYKKRKKCVIIYLGDEKWLGMKR